jgi:hypothetical protein
MSWNEFDVVTSADSKMLLEKFGMPQLLHIHDMFEFWSTINIVEKSIQQHGKGYIVPSKNYYRLDKIGCYMHTRPKYVFE